MVPVIICKARYNQMTQGTKIFQYCTCPAGRVTYNFHSSCKHTHLCVCNNESVCNKEHKGVIWLPWVILTKAPILQNKFFGKNYSSFLDFTRNYKITSGRVEFLSPCDLKIPCFHEIWILVRIHQHRKPKYLSLAICPQMKSKSE